MIRNDYQQHRIMGSTMLSPSSLALCSLSVSLSPLSSAHFSSHPLNCALYLCSALFIRCSPFFSPFYQPVLSRRFLLCSTVHHKLHFAFSSTHAWFAWSFALRLQARQRHHPHSHAHTHTYHIPQVFLFRQHQFIPLHQWIERKHPTANYVLRRIRNRFWRD